jgi:hypothetical protein
VSEQPRIGIYVHHHGGGHAARAGAIGAALAERGAVVTYLGSLPADRLGPGESVTLPLDTDLGTEPGQTPAALHFVPLGSPGLAARMAAIATWIEVRRPHLLLAWIREKTGHVGAVTRFDGERRPAADGRAADVLGGVVGSTVAERPRRVLGGCGGLAEPIATAAPEWEVLGPRPVDLDLLADCAVVVAPAGANAVAEAAFARCASSACPSRDRSPSRPRAGRTSNATAQRSSSG